ncbi:MAG: hypothetical protein ACHREM_00570 [Polyangiales bacterium]
MADAAPKRRLQPWVVKPSERVVVPNPKRVPPLMRPIKIGFWIDPAADPKWTVPLPDPKTMTDASWSSAERAVVVAYLRAHPVVALYMGASTCRICGGLNGSGEQTDGSYLWPTGFVHYLEDHLVRPPADFIDHVLAWSDSTH